MTKGGRIIAIGNLKGGTGKSTLSINLACAMAMRGARSIVIDTDPQLTATLWTRNRRLPCFVEPRPIRDLAGVGDWLTALAQARELYDRVLIDLPAVLSPALAAAFLAADAILIPTGLSPVDVEATRRTLRHTRTAAAERPPGTFRVQVVPNLVRVPWYQKAPPLDALDDLNAPVGPALRHDDAFAQSFAQSTWIGALAPRSAGTRDLRRLELAVEAMLSREALAPTAARIAHAPSPRLAAAGSTLARRAEPRSTAGGSSARPPAGLKRAAGLAPAASAG